MPHKAPPATPEQQSSKHPESRHPKDRDKTKASSRAKNLKEEGQQGNIYQNTRNQGYQQDR